MNSNRYSLIWLGAWCIRVVRLQSSAPGTLAFSQNVLHSSRLIDTHLYSEIIVKFVESILQNSNSF